MSRRRRVPRFRDLPLAMKLLVPYLVLGLIVGTAGTLLIVRQLSGQALSHLDQELRQRALDERAALHDRELYLLEAGNFAANLAGLASAVQRGDVATTARLVDSVAALKIDLGVIEVTDASGRSLVVLSRPPGTSRFRAGRPFDWKTQGLLDRALSSPGGAGVPALLRTPASSLMTLATPVCTTHPSCAATGVAFVALDMREVAGSLAAGSPGDRAFGLSILDLDGNIVAHTGPYAAIRDPRVSFPSGELRRVVAGSGENARATLYAPFSLGESPAGVLAVTQPAAPFLSGVRDTSHRLLLVLLAAMVGIAIIGVALSRVILRQLRPLLGTSRKLGAGDFDARADVLGADELGQLAAGINEMASQLQASYGTLEQRVTERTDEIHRLLADRNEFFAGLSHELRTPIAVIAAQADLILTAREGRGRFDTRSAAATVKDTASQLLSVVNQILELARAEAGHLQLKLGPVAVAALLDEMRPTLERLAGPASLHVELEAEPDLAVTADPLRLRHVVLNLIDNAVKYTPDGGRVSVKAKRAGESVEIAVSDTGLGIPEGERTRIFEPFYRVDGIETQRGEGSSGLGLALAKRLTLAQNGDLRCESEPGVGSTFVVVMPRFDAARPTLARQDDPPPLQALRATIADPPSSKKDVRVASVEPA